MGIWIGWSCGLRPAFPAAERRAFSCGGAGRCRVGLLAAAAVMLVCGARGAAAQRPGELVGRVTERGSGVAVEAAAVEILELGRRALTDAAGAYRLRGLEPGRYAVRVTRLGYAEARAAVEIENGRSHRLDLVLVPVAVALDPVTVTVRAQSGATRMERAEIVRSGARTAGELVGRLPQVVVRRTSTNGRETASIRGSGPDAVLVLVDGVALNDPITGEADLSLVSVREIEAVTVLPGGQSARYGPRAEGGVILIETRRDAGEPELAAGGGSLGAWALAAEWGGSGALAWSAGLRARGLAGEFDFELPPEAGGGAGRRRNTDLGETGAFAAASAELGGGQLRLRAGLERMRRGLPGKGFAPSAAAREELERDRASVAWRHQGPGSALHLSLAGARQTVRVRDPAPPFGLPYDDTTAVESVELDAHGERLGDGAPLEGFGAGIELEWQRIRASTLSSAAPARRTAAGLFAHGALGGSLRSVRLSLTGQLRADYDDGAGRWILNRAITGGVAAGGVSVHVVGRSSYSPPSLGDQFFREAVGVEANPQLRGERVPWEIEVGASAEPRLGPAALTVALTAYRGDVRDMIIWAPDFRFVWRPDNFHVERWGAEGRLALHVPAAELRASLHHSYARVTYDRGDGAEAVQVVYRPRNMTVLHAEWSPDPWTLDAEARRTGARNTVPVRVNRLPAFWTVAASAARSWNLGPYEITGTLAVDRLLDEKDTLIFGFPDPGRLFRAEARVRRK